MDLDSTTTTIQYRLNLARALHSVSPTLSALHTSRTAALHPETCSALQPSHCSKCGTYRFSGEHPSHLARKRRRRGTLSHQKTLQRKCRLCGLSIDLDRPSNVSAGTVSQIKEVDRGPSPGTVQTTERDPVPTLPSLPKHSRTKTSILKNMLSRDRQREEGPKSQTKRKEGHELGLAAFLKEL